MRAFSIYFSRLDDFNAVLKRAMNAGVSRMIITGTNLTDSNEAISLASDHTDLYCTVGCHPTRCTEPENDENGAEGYFERLGALIAEAQQNNTPATTGTSIIKRVVAIGECGLDYDRTQFCAKDIQIKSEKIYLSFLCC